jgi:predicted O-methyltransferase YrrM
MTINLFPQDIQQYAERYTTPETPVLAALNRETHLKVDKAVMLSGHLQGAFLQMMSCALQPRNILEIGTYTGYSAICLAAGLQADGKLYTIDIDEELYDIADKYFTAAGLRDRIVQLTGKALAIIPQLDTTFDLVFIDADKVNYAQYFDLIIDKVRPGGLILADNVLYEGDVLLPADKQSKNAAAMHLFNQKIAQDNRIEHLLLPLRDGIMVMRKK